MILPVWLFVSFGGCGLGYIEIAPEPSLLKFRIENGATSTAEVTINVALSQAEETQGDGASSQITESDNSTTVRVNSGRFTGGSLACGDTVTVSAAVGDPATTVLFSGDGTGTPGFDEGSVGLTGERFLIAPSDYACGDTIIIRIERIDSGQLDVISAGEDLPDPITPDDGQDGENPNDTPQDAQTVTLRLENATATDADISISSRQVVATTGEDGEDSADEEVVTSVRTPAGQFTTGQVECGDTLVVRAAMNDTDTSTVMFTGNGTGTAGFDGASIGFEGERLLLFDDHYECGETIVVRIEDDGSGIGQSASRNPLGSVAVFESGVEVPDPDLPIPDDGDGSDGGSDEPAEENEPIAIEVINQTESTVQINVAIGNGNLASSGGTDISGEFDVRVPTGRTSVGTTSCAQEFMIAAAHLESISSSVDESSGGGSIFDGGAAVTFHGVVLFGDGTGTDGFDGNSIPVTRGRLLQLDEHFSCGDTITITIAATNNQIQIGEDGQPELDDFGNPVIQYNVGEGTIAVTTP